MKKNRNRWVALLLSLAMVLSMCGNAALAAESLPEEALSALAEESDESSVEQPQVDQSAQIGDDESDTAQEDEVLNDEEDQEGEVSADPEEADPDEALAEQDAVQEELAAQEEPQPAEEYQLNIVQTKTVNLEYDDRFSFSSVSSGYVVAQIKSQSPTSYVVSGGKTTSTRDKAVITLNSGSNTEAVATGTGKAVVVLVKQADLPAAQSLISDPGNATQSVDAIQVDVTVKSAPLTIMFLAGQSNMEGWGSYTGGSKSQSTFQHPEHSVVCPEGEVYSTYAPGDTAWSRNRANSIGGGVTFRTYGKADNAAKFVAESLTSIYPINHSDGLSLPYRLNQLTAAGTGKTGPDSGLAYEWNRLTGDKVWTVNAAVGSSSTRLWVPGKECYNRAKALFSTALSVYKAEIAAGHYTQSHKLYFWLQGEADRKMSSSLYMKNFTAMHKYMKQSLGYEKLGIISVRASMDYKHYRDEKDLIMTTPRIVQSYMANSGKFPDIHMVSDVNERWCTNQGVSQYFKSAYGSAFSYQTHAGKLALPTRVSQVHNDIHYLQAGHNENGITAARGMYKVIKGTAQPTSVKWRNEKCKGVTELKLKKGESIIISPAVNEVAASKRVRWKFSSGLKYSGTSGKLTATASGKQKVQAIAPNGKVISTLVVSVAKGISAPTLSSVKNVKGKKITAKWKKVKGAAGYQVQCSVKSDFSSGVKSAAGEKNSATVKGLKYGKTYYVRVRAWKKQGGKKSYSAWSEVKSVKVSK